MLPVFLFSFKLKILHCYNSSFKHSLGFIPFMYFKFVFVDHSMIVFLVFLMVASLFTQMQMTTCSKFQSILIFRWYVNGIFSTIYSLLILHTNKRKRKLQVGFPWSKILCHIMDSPSKKELIKIVD